MTTQEVLDPVMSRQQARPLVNQALKHFREARRATIQVMADLRRLQDGGVHLLYGGRNFSTWAENTFEGLSAGNVRQLTRAGAVALELDRRKLIDLRKPEGVGTTGLRALSVIANDYGDDKMVEIYTTARGMLDPDREVSDQTVKAAMQLLMPPAPSELETPGAITDDDDDGDDGYDDGSESPVERELIERIRDLSWELPGSREELEQAVAALRAEQERADTTDDEKWIASKR